MNFVLVFMVILTIGCESVAIGLGSRVVGDMVLEKINKDKKEAPCGKSPT